MNDASDACFGYFCSRMIHQTLYMLLFTKDVLYVEDAYIQTHHMLRMLLSMKDASTLECFYP